MRRIGLVICLLLMTAGTCLSETGDWQILQPGWWNAPKDSIAEVRDQLLIHILMKQGEEIRLSAPLSEGAADWSILQPGWWDAPLEAVQAVEEQLTNHIDVLEGRLVIASTQDGQGSSAVPAAQVQAPSAVPAESAPAVPLASPAPPVETIPQATQVPPAAGTVPTQTIRPAAQASPAAENVPVQTIPQAIQTPSATQNVPVQTIPQAAQAPSATQNVPVQTIPQAAQTPSAAQAVPAQTLPPAAQNPSNAGIPAAGASQDDPQAYAVIDFDHAFGNAGYIGKKVVLNGRVENIQVTAQQSVYTIRQSNAQVWEILCPAGTDSEPARIGDEITVLGVVKDNTRIQSQTNIRIITVTADYVETQE